MTRTKTTHWVFALMLGLQMTPAAVFAAESVSVWDEGLAAYQRNDYTAALISFRAARDTGQAGPAVHYNIAVCEFELGDYEAARRTFEHLETQYPELRPLANYNLGLIAVEQSELSQARRYFLAAYRGSTDDETLRVLASTMLRKIQPPDTDGSASRWSGAFGARAAYDDNIVLRAESGIPVNTATDSSLLDAFGSVRASVLRIDGMSVEASLYDVSYLDNDDLDQTALRLGLGYDWGNQSWQGRVVLSFGHSTFGGNSYEDFTTIDAVVSRALSDAASIYLRYQYNNIEASDSAFAAIDGSQDRFELGYRWRGSITRFDATFQVEENDRTDAGVSASRNRIRLRFRRDLSDTWHYELGGDYRASRYSKLQPTRSEDLVTLSTGLGRRLNKGWSILGEVRFSDNSSSDPVYSYNRAQVGIAILKAF
jgi:tetratricopeptide (TPR) repeat protein